MYDHDPDAGGPDLSQPGSLPRRRRVLLQDGAATDGTNSFTEATLLYLVESRAGAFHAETGGPGPLLALLWHAVGEDASPDDRKFLARFVTEGGAAEAQPVAAEGWAEGGAAAGKNPVDLPVIIRCDADAQALLRRQLGHNATRLTVGARARLLGQAPGVAAAGAAGPAVVALTQRWRASYMTPWEHDPYAKMACTVCEREGIGIRKCSRCKIAWYCGPDCQKPHWPTHKEQCKRWQAAPGLH